MIKKLFNYIFMDYSIPWINDTMESIDVNDNKIDKQIWSAYAITKFIDTRRSFETSLSFYWSKESAFDAFVSIVQSELFFLDESPLLEEFIDKHSRADYSLPVSSIVDWAESLRLGAYPEGMITAEYFDWCTDTYRIQLVECKESLSISL